MNIRELKEIEEDKLKSFIYYESHVSTSRALFSYLFMTFVVSIPTAILGIYSNITRAIYLPIVVVIVMWNIILMINMNNKKQFTLFQGVFSVFISLTFLIASYKISALLFNIKFIHIIVIFLLYIIVNYIHFNKVLSNIKAGYYLKNEEQVSFLSVVLIVSLLGAIFIRLLLGNAKQTIITEIFILLLIFMGFLFSLGMVNFLKYYIMKKYISEI